MTETLRAYRNIGFDGPIRTDHAPSMEGEGEATGYAMLGHIYALGYLQGILHGIETDTTLGNGD